MEQINFTVLGRRFDLHKQEYEQAVLRAVRSGWYIMGNELSAFEEEFAGYLGVRYCVGLNSGTDALILAIRALQIGAGDEVIVPAGAYIASVIGITENQATPVFVDSDSSLVMDADAIESRITDKTRAILPVHMYGQACNMPEIMEIAKKHRLYVIEDCAQSHGAAIDGKKTGTFGDIGCFSFYPTKPLGAFGDAGAIVTNHESLRDRIRMLGNYGSRRKYYNETEGVNSRMDEVQAAVLRAGLKYLDAENRMRREISWYYRERIHNERLVLPQVKKEEEHVFHIFPVLAKNQRHFQNYLKEHGIMTQIHYPVPPYLADCYKEKDFYGGNFPQAAYTANHEVSLPLYAGLRREEAARIVDVCNRYQEETRDEGTVYL